MKYYGEINNEFSIINKKYLDENTSKTFYKHSIEEMETIINAKHGDLCIVCLSDNSEKKLYRYFSENEINGIELETPYWGWITDLGDNLTNSVLNLTSGEWDFSSGKIARINLMSDTVLNITNINGICYGAIDVYGNYNLILPSNSYSFPPDWNYLVPNSNQHYRYSFYYDGNKFDWNRSVRENE